MIAELTAKETGVIGSAGKSASWRIASCMAARNSPRRTLITDEVLAEIEALNPLAPLHNPVNVAGIREMRRLFPGRAARGRVRHGVSPHAAVLRLSLRPAVRVLREEGRAPLRLSRHVAPLRRLRAARVPEAPAERAAHRQLPPRQRRLAVRRGPRPLGGHDDGLHARRRADHGHALRRPRSGRARLPRTRRRG